MLGEGILILLPPCIEEGALFGRGGWVHSDWGRKMVVDVVVVGGGGDMECRTQHAS
jgi:hypothetical protein